MPGITRGDLSPAGYFERILAALIRTSERGELRIKGSLFDKLNNEATTLSFFWDGETQEIVVRGARSDEMHIETFRVTPENVAPAKTQTPARVIDPLDRTLFRRDTEPDPPLTFTPSNLRPIDDAAAAESERAKIRTEAKRLVQEMLRRNRVANG